PPSGLPWPCSGLPSSTSWSRTRRAGPRCSPASTSRSSSFPGSPPRHWHRSAWPNWCSGCVPAAQRLPADLPPRHDGSDIQGATLMEIILLQRIEKLGQMGDVVRVKNGYARNYLLPKNMALRATEENLKRFERERAQLEARNLEQRKEAEAVAARLDSQSFVILRQAGDSGQLYGSVTTRDIATRVTEGGVSVSRTQVVLDRQSKTLGVHDIRVSLHPEVSVTIQVNVARTEEEAERQARGEDVLAELPAEEEEAAVSPEEVFEDERIAREVEQELVENLSPEASPDAATDTQPAQNGDAEAGETAESGEPDRS